jgi:phospholipid-transporting ATPase
MSVICRTPEGKIKLYCKGADVTILARISKEQTILTQTNQHLQMFAAEGLRTLCCTVLDLPEKQYNDWSKKFHEASIAISDRAAKVSITLIINIK